VYLHNNLKLSFEIFSFTDASILFDFAKEETISLLIISENLFPKFNKMALNEAALFKNILVLDEGTGTLDEKLPDDNDIKIVHVSKYQEASRIVDGIIEFCVDSPDEFGGASMKMTMTKGSIYGFYSPINKCGQTTLSREVAKKLSMKGKTIFLSFESFSSLPFMLGALGREDMTDLLYYAECERAKLGIYLEKIKVPKDGVDYILPARTSMQLKSISFEKMKNLLEILTHDMGYENVVLDMTNYPEGFLDILLLCKKIVTIVRENALDNFRQKQYEEVLMDSGYEEIRSKTQKILLPDMRDRRSFEACINSVIKGDEH
jgi:hypothetical protein